MLFFVPAVLHGDGALMRVLVDKHLTDSWVLAWAPGFTSDVAQEWANYKVGTDQWGIGHRDVAWNTGCCRLDAGHL